MDIADERVEGAKPPQNVQTEKLVPFPPPVKNYKYLLVYVWYKDVKNKPHLDFARL